MLAIGYRRWLDQNYFLNRMSLKELVVAYVTYPAIQVYAALALVTGTVAILYAEHTLPLLLSFAAGILVYPAVWYALHRFVLHGRWLYKSPLTAKLWKRIHYDHHQEPNDLSVLFGALYTTLPTIVAATVPIGWLIGGFVGAMAALATGLLTTCFYEFSHCIQHLPYMPKQASLKRMKQLHLAHHFHNEQGNYGITNFFCDHVLGTFYDQAQPLPKSDTVRNLGYAGAEIDHFPWVARLSNSPSDDPRTAANQN